MCRYRNSIFDVKQPFIKHFTYDFFGAFQGQDSSTRAVDDLLERLDAGEFDLVAVGRALLQDPNWANKIKENRTDELEQYSGKALATLS